MGTPISPASIIHQNIKPVLWSFLFFIIAIAILFVPIKSARAFEPCSNDSDCGSCYYCSLMRCYYQGGGCGYTFCSSSANCPAGQNCIAGTCTTPMGSTPQCYFDNDCSSCNSCISGSCVYQSNCQPPPTETPIPIPTDTPYVAPTSPPGGGGGPTPTSRPGGAPTPTSPPGGGGGSCPPQGASCSGSTRYSCNQLLPGTTVCSGGPVLKCGNGSAGSRGYYSSYVGWDCTCLTGSNTYSCAQGSTNTVCECSGYGVTNVPTSAPTPTPTPTPIPWCGDGKCNGAEVCNACTFDCGRCGAPVGWCGDLICDASLGENAGTCASDCGGVTPVPTSPPVCGNGVCEFGENISNCFADCFFGTPSNTPIPVRSISFTADPNPCTLVGATCASTITWSTVGYTNVTLSNGAGQVGSGNSGTHNDSGITASGSDYTLKSNSSTISTIHVYGKTLGAWIKLRDTSFQSTSSLTNTVPNSVSAFDSDDPGHAYFIDSAVTSSIGVVSAPGISSTSNVSQRYWEMSGYSPTLTFNKSLILSYIKARKDHINVLNDPSLTDIANNAINIINGNITITDGNKNVFDNKNLLLVVDGSVVFNLASGVFNPTNGNIALIATTINFSSGANYISTIRGIYVADTINTGVKDNSGLKIIGNISTATFNNGRNQNAAGNLKPSVFVVADPTLYTTLLPYLSTATYEWKQIQ